MFRLFFSLVCLALLGCYSDGMVAQVTRNPSQPSATINSPSYPAPGTLASRQPNTQAKALLDEGTKLVDAGQLSQAAETFQRAITLDPEYAEAYSSLGRTYFKLRQWQEALDNLHRAAALNKRQREAQATFQQTALLKEPNEVDTRSQPIAASTKGSSVLGPTHPLERKRVAKTALPLPASKTITSLSNVEVKTLRVESAAFQQLSIIGPPPEQVGGTKTVVQFPAANPINDLSDVELKTLAVESVSSEELASLQPPPLAEQRETTLATTPSLPTTTPNTDEAKTPTEPPIKKDAKKQNAASEAGSAEPQPESPAAETKSIVPISIKPVGDDAALTKVYRVGPGDVLDVRVNKADPAQSTLFTVMPSGLLEHPMLTEPLKASGLTVEEIGTKIQDDLKQRAVIEDPQVIVGVRDYASHSILVSGLVKDSGTKFLRREAIPLYVVVADAQPLAQAAKVTVVRNELNQMYEIDLTQAADMNLLVRPGDVVTLQPNVTQFFYIGGEVKSPGEKTYRRGLTLTQAIISAGGWTPKSKLAEIGRDDGRGFLVGTRFNLKDIQIGKTPDPLIRPADRIMILR